MDDPESQVLADWYGIVMGTSHEEPMMRSTPIEWDLFGQGAWNYTTNRQNVTDFWTVGAERAKNFENVFTLGMRGKSLDQLTPCVIVLTSCRFGRLYERFS